MVDELIIGNMKNEIIPNNELSFSKKIFDINNFCETWKSIVKIELKDGTKASGFFIKYKRNKNHFYCLMTNEHVITTELTEKREKILIKYQNEKKSAIIELNQKERIIICLLDILNIDLTIVQIIPKDQINDFYFLTPNIKHIGKKYLKGKKIQILQFPAGKNLSFSEGKILGVDDSLIYHDANTYFGSSGSPIFLKDEKGVIGIHKGATSDKTKNVGFFIFGLVNDIINQIQRNGEGIEYYSNGKIKYEGNFLNDEYEGEGKYYEEDGRVYIGFFKKGFKHGDGCIFKNGILISEGTFNCGWLVKHNYKMEYEEKRFQEGDLKTAIYKGIAQGIANALVKKIFGIKPK